MNRKRLTQPGLINQHHSDVKERVFIKTKKKPNVFEDVVTRHSTLSPELKELLTTPIEKTNLSVRVKNICWNAEINKVSDLVSYSRGRFGKLRNAGKKNSDEAELFLKSRGLSWDMQLSR